MSRKMSIYAMAGYLCRAARMVSENRMKSRPRELRKIRIVDNKHNPDPYIAGLVSGFLGLQFLSKWYPVLTRKDGKAAFLKGVSESMSGAFIVGDIIGDLWRVRMTDPEVFDAALMLSRPVDFKAILDMVNSSGEEEFLRLKKEREREMEMYGLIDDEWLDHRKHANEQERETVNAQL